MLTPTTNLHSGRTPGGFGGRGEAEALRVDDGGVGTYWELMSGEQPVGDGQFTSCRAVILATIGLRQKKARMAANRLQPKAAQSTGVQEPVASSSFAAPHPANIDALWVRMKSVKAS